MKPRQTVERYWSIWTLNDAGTHYAPTWEPFAEGMTSRRVATAEMRKVAKRYPKERFAIVRSVHTRLAAPTGSKEIP